MTMHANLMCSAGQEFAEHQTSIVLFTTNLVISDREFATLWIHHSHLLPIDRMPPNMILDAP